MTPALALVIIASIASVAAVWPQVRGALRGHAVPVVTGRTFVAFALWTIDGGLAHSPALVAAGAIGLVLTSFALSVRVLLGDALSARDRASASEA